MRSDRSRWRYYHPQPPTTAGSTNVNCAFVEVSDDRSVRPPGRQSSRVAGNESTAGVVSLMVVDRICGNCGSSCRTTPRTVTIESEFGDGTKVIVELSADTTTSLGLVAPSTIRPLSASTPIVSGAPMLPGGKS